MVAGSRTNKSTFPQIPKFNNKTGGQDRRERLESSGTALRVASVNAVHLQNRKCVEVLGLIWKRQLEKE